MSQRSGRFAALGVVPILWFGMSRLFFCGERFLRKFSGLRISISCVSVPVRLEWFGGTFYVKYMLCGYRRLLLLLLCLT
jgi:hypothetical protein